MIERIRFKNFKALREVEVKLGAFNLVVGPNGSGKSSLLQGFEVLANPGSHSHRQFATLGAATSDYTVDVHWKTEGTTLWGGCEVSPSRAQPHTRQTGGRPLNNEIQNHFWQSMGSIRVYALEPSKMAQAVDSRLVKELSRTGDNLAGALTFLRDQDEDAYDHLREELQRWLPEFDSIAFTNDANGFRQLYLRQAGSKLQIPAAELSEGTLLALALLTIVYQPGAPTLIGLEEPDRGLHPRLLRDVRDALYRLSFPGDFGLKRPPVQVVATTHSPLFLDLFKDHPEQIIIAEKSADGSASFRSLADDPHLQEMIGDAPLGEVWYSGVLGGVPTHT